MIPILFPSTETDFTSNGIGRLVDCISCQVTEEDKGIYELELQYPVDGALYDELLDGGIIGVIHDDNHDIQPFDIYRTETTINGIVTVNAHHISYRLNNIILSPYTAATASAAVAGISTHSVNTNPFTFSTDVSASGSFKISAPSSVRSVLFGTEGSLIDTFGTADFKFDKFTVQMLASRGSDTGVTVRYGKNLVGIDRETDDSGTYNAIAPHWTDGETYVYPDAVIVYPTTQRTPVKPVAMDMSDKFDEQPTKTQVANAAKAYLDTNKPWEQIDTIDIDFVALWQTEEYKDLAEIQRVGLCDTVSIYWTDVGIVSEKAKVVKVVYDVLSERFLSIKVGTVTTDHVSISDGTQQTTGKKTNFVIETVEETNATSIAAGSYRSTSLSVSKDGYRPIALAGFTTNNQNVCIVKAILNGNSVEFNFRNVSGSAANSKAGFTVLYVPN